MREEIELLILKTSNNAETPLLSMGSHHQTFQAVGFIQQESPPVINKGQCKITEWRSIMVVSQSRPEALVRGPQFHVEIGLFSKKFDLKAKN